MIVKSGDKIQVEYTGKLNDGTIFDKSEQGNPLEFIVNSGQIIPGFDNAVEGMKLNEEKTITIKSEDAYGSKREDLVGEFPKDSLPPDLEIKKGGMLALKMPTGETIHAAITDVTENTVVIDANHPLSGKDLIFDIKVVGISSP